MEKKTFTGTVTITVDVEIEAFEDTSEDMLASLMHERAFDMLLESEPSIDVEVDVDED